MTMRAVKPTINATINALEAGDLAAGRRAAQQYNILWHGVEVWLNVRSKPGYDKLEGDIQGRMDAELAKPDANAATALGIAKELNAMYDEVIRLSDTGAPMSPIFDDLQVVRLNRAYLAQGVVADLAANNLPSARTMWATFASGEPRSVELIRGRNATVAAEIDTAFAAASAAFADPSTSVAALKPLAGAINTKMGVGVGLIGAAARGAVVGKTKVVAADLAPLKALNGVRLAVQKAADLRRANDPSAGAAAAEAAGPANGQVAPALQAKNANNADVALTTALANFVKGVANPDLAAFETANTNTTNAINNAQQVLIGQFWSDPRVQKYIAALPTK